jgi:hypothetical protein
VFGNVLRAGSGGLTVRRRVPQIVRGVEDVADQDWTQAHRYLVAAPATISVD